MNIDAVKRQIEESIPWRDGVLTVEQAFALVAEVERLRAERDAYHEAWAAAQVRLDCGADAFEAVREERAAVVAFLRDRDKWCREWGRRENAVSATYRTAAESIERGEHRREEEK
jgi:hypothetical protein